MHSRLGQRQPREDRRGQRGDIDEEDRTCYNCGGVGNISRDCPESGREREPREDVALLRRELFHPDLHCNNESYSPSNLFQVLCALLSKISIANCPRQLGKGKEIET